MQTSMAICIYFLNFHIKINFYKFNYDYHYFKVVKLKNIFIEHVTMKVQFYLKSFSRWKTWINETFRKGNDKEVYI